MVDKKCAACGRKFTAKRAAAKYCSEKCRKRGQRQPAPAAKPPVDQAEGGLPEEAGLDLPLSLVAATLTELVKAGRENTPAGQSAILLAYRIERSHADTGSSVAALVKQHSATLAEALKSAEKKSAVDELKKRRDAKRAG